jgi:hypothetical protein
MANLNLPPDVEAVIREFRVWEFSTLVRDGTPVAWPLAARYRPEQNRFILTTSIGFPQKAFNIQREEEGWVFYPQQIITGAAGRGLIGQMRVTFKARRAAKKYLEKRGLARPTIAWDGIKALWAEVSEAQDV